MLSTVLILAIPLSLVLVGYVVMASCAPRVKNGEAMESLYACLLAGFLIGGPLALLFAEVGHFSLGGVALAIMMGVLVAVTVTAWLRRLNLAVGRQSLRWDSSQTIALGLLLVAAILYLRPFENILVGRDAGVYVNTGIHIARSGSILFRDDFFAGLPEAAKQELLYRFPSAGLEQIPFRLPGFYWIEEPGLVVPQFLHLYPAWIAIFYSMGGLGGALLATPFFALLSLGGLYALGKQLFGQNGGLLALLFGLLNPAQLWFARYANSEIAFQALLLGGLYAWGRWQRGEGPFWGAIAGLAFGELFLTRIDAAGLLVPLALFLGYRYLMGQLDRTLWAFLLPFAVLLVWSGAHVALLAFPYAWEINRLMVTPLLTSHAVAFLILAVLASGAALVLGRSDLGQQIWGWLLVQRRIILALVAAVLILLAFYTYFQPPWPVVGAYNEGNFQRLSWYLTPLGLLLAVAGLAGAIASGDGGAMSLLVGSLLVYASIYLTSSGISPDHIFAARRYLPVIFPMSILLTVRAFHSLGLGPRWPLVGAFLRIAVGLFLAAGLIVTSVPLATHREFAGAIAQVEQLAAGLPEKAIILFENQSFLGTFVGPPLTYVYDREAFYAGVQEVSPGTLAAVAWAAGRERRVLFFVSEQGRQILLPDRDLDCEQAGTFVVKALERSIEHFPQGLEEFTMPYRLCRVQQGSGGATYAAATLPGLAGRVTSDGVARYATDSDLPGFLAYGPYARFPAGEWQATFFLRGHSGANPAAILDVVDGEARVLLARRTVTGEELADGYRGYAIDFRNPTGQLLQFRVYYAGQGELWLERIVVAPQGSK